MTCIPNVNSNFFSYIFMNKIKKLNLFPKQPAQQPASVVGTFVHLSAIPGKMLMFGGGGGGMRVKEAQCNTNATSTNHCASTVAKSDAVEQNENKKTKEKSFKWT